MCDNDFYSVHVRQERMFVKNEIANSLKADKLKLCMMSITDDGYVVEAESVTCRDCANSFSELCKRVDNLKFENYSIVDIDFSEDKVTLVLVPITADAMNRFVWNYIACYFPFVSELEALSLTIGILERMIEPIGKARKVLEKYIADTIQ